MVLFEGKGRIERGDKNRRGGGAPGDRGLKHENERQNNRKINDF